MASFEEDGDYGSELEDNLISINRIVGRNNDSGDEDSDDNLNDNLDAILNLNRYHNLNIDSNSDNSILNLNQPDNQSSNNLNQELNLSDIFESIEQMNEEDLWDFYKSMDANLIYSNEGRPYTDFCHLNQTNDVPFNDNKGSVNYDNLPDNINSIVDVFKLFITEEISDLICKYTNIHSTLNHDTFMTTKQDLLNFIGVLIYQGACKDNELPISNLWSKFGSKPFYYSAASRMNFEKHLEHIRFDDKRKRVINEFGFNEDKIAPVREILDLFKKTLPKYYIPSKELTIDETVSKFTGKSPIKVYAGALKPNSYGFLFRSLCDANNIFLINFELYAGKSTIDKSVSSLMERLIIESNLANKGHTVVADNFYGEIKTMENFYHKLGTNTVFTLRGNRSFIPEYLKETKGREKRSSRFLFTDPSTNLPPVTIQSFITNSKKNLLLASTLHHDGKILDDQRGLSCLNNFYNQFKGGVDLFDQIISLFTCKRRTYRWSLSLFYTIIDMACINAYTMCGLLNLVGTSLKDARRNFLIQLSIELTSKTALKRKAFDIQHLNYTNIYIDEMNKRLKTNEPHKNLSFSTNLTVSSSQPSSSKSPENDYCDYYLNQLKRRTSKLSKTDKKCIKCECFTCKFHCKTIYICFKCKENTPLSREEHSSV